MTNRKAENPVENSISNKLQGKHILISHYIMKFNFNLIYLMKIFVIHHRAVKFTSKLFGRALSRRIKATVLYATETGKSEQYAKQLVELLGHAFNAQVSLYYFRIITKCFNLEKYIVLTIICIIMCQFGWGNR